MEVPSLPKQAAFSDAAPPSNLPVLCWMPALRRKIRMASEAAGLTLISQRRPEWKLAAQGMQLSLQRSDCSGRACLPQGTTTLQGSQGLRPSKAYFGMQDVGMACTSIMLGFMSSIFANHAEALPWKTGACLQQAKEATCTPMHTLSLQTCAPGSAKCHAGLIRHPSALQSGDLPQVNRLVGV